MLGEGPFESRAQENLASAVQEKDQASLWGDTHQDASEDGK
jgi:hypothetical protein